MSKQEEITTVAWHLGMGDALICQGLVRTLVERGRRLKLFHRGGNKLSMELMFADLISEGRIELQELMFGPGHGFREMIENQGPNSIRLGFMGKGWTGGRWWDKVFYRQAGVDYQDKWEKFRVPDIPGIRPVQRFLHDDSTRGFNIPMDGFRPRDDKRPTVFDYLPEIRGAEEIHCIDSCFAILADLINAPGKKFLHRYARATGSLPPTYQNRWLELGKRPNDHEVMSFAIEHICVTLLGIKEPVVMEIGAGPRLETGPLIKHAKEYILVDPILELAEKWRVRLTANTEFKGKLVVHNVAVTDKCGLIEMRVAPAVINNNPSGRQGVSIVESEAAVRDSPPLCDSLYDTWQKRTVLGVTFDLIDPGNLDFLLLDVEGHELVALKNMVSRPKVLDIEIWDDNPKRQETLDLIHSYGYSLFRQRGVDYLFIHNTATK